MKKSIWLLVLAFAIAGCSGSHDTNLPQVKETPNVIYPLTVGNSWRYSLIEFDENYNILDQFPFTKTIHDSMVFDEHLFFEDDNIFEINRSDGLWIYPSDGIAYLFLKYPCISGEVYLSPHFNSYYGQKDTISTTVVSVNERVSVPAGVFSCIKYQVFLSPHPPTDTIYYYAAPNIGIVQEEVFRNGQSGLKHRREIVSLLEYNLVK